MLLLPMYVYLREAYFPRTHLCNPLAGHEGMLKAASAGGHCRTLTSG
jgi:hypothetical protein